MISPSISTIRSATSQANFMSYDHRHACASQRGITSSTSRTISGSRAEGSSKSIILGCIARAGDRYPLLLTTGKLTRILECLL